MWWMPYEERFKFYPNLINLIQWFKMFIEINSVSGFLSSLLLSKVESVLME